MTDRRSTTPMQLVRNKQQQRDESILAAIYIRRCGHARRFGLVEPHPTQRRSLMRLTTDRPQSANSHSPILSKVSTAPCRSAFTPFLSNSYGAYNAFYMLSNLHRWI